VGERERKKRNNYVYGTVSMATARADDSSGHANTQPDKNHTEQKGGRGITAEGCTGGGIKRFNKGVGAKEKKEKPKTRKRVNRVED